jgi:hypothetical protein
MVFSLKYTIREGPQLDSWRSWSLTSINCQYGIVLYLSNFIEWEIICIMTFSVARLDTWNDSFAF